MNTKLIIQPVYKSYVMDQMSLMPQSYSEKIPPKHIVRTVNEAVERIDLKPLMAQYKGGGTSSYHPKMMLKVLVYAYSQRIYSSRRIAKALREDITFMWLSGGNTPNFRTINDFRGSRMKAVIDDVFTAVLEYLIENGYVKLENYFVDGTKLEANASKHKVIWAKSREKYEQRVREQIQSLLGQIEQTNEEEQAEYKDADLEELGESSQEDMNSERLKQKIDALSERLRQKRQPTRREASIMRKLEGDCLPRLEKYEQQEELLAGRSSCSSTDPDATGMMMKEDRGIDKPWPKPAYNLQAGTEGQFIVGFSVHDRPGDTTCLIPHLESVRQGLGRLPGKIVADAGYGSEENYSYLEQHHLENYVKYSNFYQETHRQRKVVDERDTRQYRAERFPYDAEKDEFICPGNKRLHYVKTTSYTSVNGYQTERRHYECEDCQDCLRKRFCTQARGNRQIQTSLKLRDYWRQARENLTSAEGKLLRARRSVETETIFGHVKHNMGIRRFLLRGLEKVKTEWGLISIAVNMQKMVAA